jgi:ComF family protein
MAEPPAYDGLRAPYGFSGPARDMVHNLKYRNVRASAPNLGRLMADYLWSEPVPGGVLVPVPLHSRRERSRGFNQSALLAREVGRLTGIPVAEDILRRSRNTAPQVSMAGPVERKENIEGAFECIDDVAGLEILLIDDVVTTGSTMSTCAEPLKAEGASSVWGLALAR